MNKIGVERDEEGLACAWRILKAGENLRTCQGADVAPIVLSESDLSQIVERYNAKGLDIPLDADHFLHHIAQASGISKDSLVAAAPCLK